jgi:hypothetical protein
MRLRFKGLPLDSFEPLFGLDDKKLAQQNVRRLIADEMPGFPCRVTLEDANPGESLLLLSHSHQPSASPYRSSGPIFVRESARESFDRTDMIPPVLCGRLLSLRAYDRAGMMVDAEIVDGDDVEALLQKFLARDEANYVHIHNARRGCYACAVERG